MLVWSAAYLLVKMGSRKDVVWATAYLLLKQYRDVLAWVTAYLLKKMGSRYRVVLVWATAYLLKKMGSRYRDVFVWATAYLLVKMSSRYRDVLVWATAYPYMKMDSRYRDGLKSGQRRICWVRYASGTRDGFSRLRGHVSVHRPVDHALLKKDCLQIYQPLCFRRNVKGNTSSLSMGSFMSSIF